jgi:AcrR family transcriptional regulator
MNRPLASSPRSSAFDGKLAQVLSVGARVIARQGYGQATIRQVASEAEMSLAGLYHYFSSKEELLFLIQFHTFDAILAQLERKLEGIADPAARLRVMVVNHLEHFLARMDDLRVCARELESLHGAYYEQVRTLRQRYLKITLEIVESLGGPGEPARINPRLATLYLFGMLNWIYMWHPAAQRTPAEELADQLISLFLLGYLPRSRSDVAPPKEARPHV